MERINKEILGELLEERLENNLEISLYKNLDCKKALSEETTLTTKLDELNFDIRQKLVVGRILSANNLTSSIYGKEAYKQGFGNSLTLIFELCKLI